jgi:hypothetical protein
MTQEGIMKISIKRALAPLAVLGMVVALSGCVAYPAGPYAGGPYGSPYYAAPAAEVVLPPVYVGGGWGWGHGGR